MLAWRCTLCYQLASAQPPQLTVNCCNPAIVNIVPLLQIQVKAWFAALLRVSKTLQSDPLTRCRCVCVCDYSPDALGRARVLAESFPARSSKGRLVLCCLDAKSV